MLTSFNKGHLILFVEGEYIYGIQFLKTLENVFGARIVFSSGPLLVNRECKVVEDILKLWQARNLVHVTALVLCIK